MDFSVPSHIIFRYRWLKRRMWSFDIAFLFISKLNIFVLLQSRDDLRIIYIININNSFSTFRSEICVYSVGVRLWTFIPACSLAHSILGIV